MELESLDYTVEDLQLGRAHSSQRQVAERTEGFLN
jgi:hypothetical protein